MILCLALLLTTLTDFFRSQDDRRALLVGVCCAALVLARLDMIVVVPIVGLAVAVSTRRIRALLSWVVGGLLIGVPYAIWHLARNGQVLTTSATVKQRWIEQLVTDQFGGWFSPGTFACWLVSPAGWSR